MGSVIFIQNNTCDVMRCTYKEYHNYMKKVIVIGCPGAGKSTFSRKLAAKTSLPIHYLDMIWHRQDKSNIGREALIIELNKIIKGDEWIIDGNYLGTLPLRLQHCDTVIFLDLPIDVCLSGARERIGKAREDMPWQETEMDPEFYQYILDFPKTQLPVINDLLDSCRNRLNIIRFKSRADADAFIESL